MFPKSARARATSGAKMLDQYMPGWADKIDTEDLSLRSETRCIIGQALGNFSNGIDALRKEGARIPDIRVMGFAPKVRNVFGHNIVVADNEALIREWTRLVKQRAVEPEVVAA